MTPQPSPALNLLENHGGELAFGGRGHAPPHQQFAFSPPPTALHIRDSLARRMHPTFGGGPLSPLLKQ